ncbi:hypothetical protein P691DRAFT_737419 [Macrolepiota fuliginosa MF-IS2]|uniref:Uncharacterized protein n=1 Tax=Macrolepiota fuliginosa MF-IS2 TaxID=1400762 RepID=A0A9P5X2U2_9AGAR|nr:hypothetical protein P691DRAFT_737419 [Macrolepiota fuliginosa MF-IS2]
MNTATNANETIIFRIDQVTGEKHQFRACTTCKHFHVPIQDQRKTCERCREKSRLRNRMRAKAQAEPTGQMDESASPAVFGPDSSASRPSKREAEKTLRELEGDEQKRALKMMKSSLNAMAQTSTFHEVPPRKTPSHTEYQKASLLYDAAKAARSKNGLCNFSGCHSIVRCDNIDHGQRASMVTKDLRKIVKFPFKYDAPIRRVISENGVRLVYSCTCKTSVPKQLTSSTNPSGPKPKFSAQSDENTGHTREVCGGSVSITVRDDTSHPLPIAGQQVIVRIKH